MATQKEQIEALARDMATLAQEITKLRECVTDLENRPPQIEHHYHDYEGGLP